MLEVHLPFAIAYLQSDSVIPISTTTTATATATATATGTAAVVSVCDSDVVQLLSNELLPLSLEMFICDSNAAVFLTLYQQLIHTLTHARHISYTTAATTTTTTTDTADAIEHRAECLYSSFVLLLQQLLCNGISSSEFTNSLSTLFHNRCNNGIKYSFNLTGVSMV